MYNMENVNKEIPKINQPAQWYLKRSQCLEKKFNDHGFHYKNAKNARFDE